MFDIKTSLYSCQRKPLQENLPIPRRIYLDVTNFCPLNCIHCYANSGSASDNELTLSELKNLIQQIIELGVKNIVISGGEPLSRSDIFELLSFCADKDLNTTLLTNGLFIDYERSKKLSDLNTEIRISIDGCSDKTHDYIRGKGNFKIVLKAIDNLKRAKVRKLSIHFTINRINIVDILQLPYFLNEINIHNIVISVVKPSGRALKYPDILIEPSLVLLVKERLNTIYRNKFITFHKYDDKNWGGFACPAAYAKCGISAVGRITPCVFLGDDYLGESVRNKSLKELWYGDSVLTKTRILLPNPQCSTCSCFSDFNGGCRTRAVYYNKDICGPDPYCCEIKKGREFLKNINLDFVSS